jgi:hypothetical protein
MRVLCLLLVTLAAASAGCYSYVPTRLDAVAEGDPVRLRVSADEAERLEPVRLTDARLIEGTIVRRDTARVFVDTRVGTLDAQRGQRAFIQRIDVPLAAIQEIESRRPDNLKTAAAVGAVGLAIGLGVLAALQPGEGGPGGPVDPVPEMRGSPFRVLYIRF